VGAAPAPPLVLEAALGGRPTPAGLGRPDLAQLRLATAYADLLDARGEHELAREWYSAIAAADPDDLTGVSEHFVEDDQDSEPADLEFDGAEVTERDGVSQRDDESDQDLGRALSDEVGGDVTQDDIEAEVAELLGEIPPPVERDHTRLFQEATADEEQVPPMD
jgi:hypothetical protein